MPYKSRDADAACKRRWLLSHRAEHNRSVHLYYLRMRSSRMFQQKKRARRAVELAVIHGRMRRPKKCSVCRQPKRLEAHHHRGYAKKHWLAVIWLCVECHWDRHR